MYSIMKIIQFSPIGENSYAYLDNEGYINIYNEQNELSYNSIDAELIVEYISYSYDGQYFLYRQQIENQHKLTILPYTELIHNNINRGEIFNFVTYGTLVNFILSPNRNQVAIIFELDDMRFSDSINGMQEVDYENRNKIFLHVYDFTAGNVRLIFQKSFDNRIHASLSEMDTIAVSTFYLNEGSYVQHYVIDVFNLNTGDLILNTNIDDTILEIQYLNVYVNHLLLITVNFDDEFKLKIINLDDNFAITYIRTISGNVNSFDISRQGNIALGMNNGLLYFRTFDDEPISEFLGDNILSVSFSTSSNKIAVVFSKFSDQLGRYVIDTSVLNLLTNEITGHVVVMREPQNIPDIEIEDTELDFNVPYKKSNSEKLQTYSGNNCFDIIELNEHSIGNFLSADPDNIVIFYKKPSDADFLATCISFTILKKYLKDTKMVFYRCDKGKDYRTYHQSEPHFLKIPTGSGNIFVNYTDIKTKYMQRQNMIFFEYTETVDTTISYDASITMNFVSSNHCQQGSIIDVYRIIF